MSFLNFAAKAAFVFGASLVSAGPILQSRDPGVSITQVPNPSYNATGGSGPAAYKYAFAKYGVELPVSEDINGTVAANPYPSSYDREYLCQVSIGTPAQVLPLDFDTGSSDLWVFSTETLPSEVNGQKLYNPAKSTTAKLVNGETWSVSYGDGSSSSGDIYTDLVSIGALTITTQDVESAENVSPGFTKISASSGLLGLAFKKLNTCSPTLCKTPMNNLASTLTANLFTANLKKGAVGNYNFGYINTTEYTGAITYTPVLPAYGYWTFTASGYQIGTATFVTLSTTAIADTGTSLLLIPTAVVSAYYAKVAGAYYDSSIGAYTFPCASILPDYTFGVGAYRGVVPGTYINYGALTSSRCYGGIQSQGTLPFSIYGDILLKAQFVIFDVANNRLGFANKET